MTKKFTIEIEYKNDHWHRCHGSHCPVNDLTDADDMAADLICEECVSRGHCGVKLISIEEIK